MSIASSADYNYTVIQEHLDSYKLEANARELVNVLDDYIGEGYGKCTKDDLRK